MNTLFWLVGLGVCTATVIAITFVAGCVVWAAFTALLFAIRLWWLDFIVKGKFWLAWWQIFNGGIDMLETKKTGKRLYRPLWPRDDEDRCDGIAG